MQTALALLLVLLASTANAQMNEYPALYDVAGIAADDVLQMRSAPDAGADSVGSLAANATGVEVVGLSEDGMWVELSRDEAAGWVAVKFLVPQDGGAWFDLNTPIYCLGTEPFWRIDIDPLAKMGTYNALDGVDQPLVIGAMWSNQGAWATTAAVRFDDQNAMAVMHGEACSDGMSERAYGISIDLVVTEAEAGNIAWSGCCSITP
jgi:uncharacterized membrane protein